MLEDKWESYFIKNTNTLKNKLGIISKEELQEREKIITLKKLAYLDIFPIEGKFDSNHLVAIHRFLFDDIYPFAGVYRTCTMAKTREFSSPNDIEKLLNECLKKMNNEVEQIISLDQFAWDFLPRYYYELLYIHPFREGNGRTIREFLREFVLSKNDILKFDVKLDLSKMNKKKELEAVKNYYMYRTDLGSIFKMALVPLDDNIKINKL